MGPSVETTDESRRRVGVESLTRNGEKNAPCENRLTKVLERVQKTKQGSFLAPELDWTDGDLVFTNSTCFAEDTLLAISVKAEALRTGARVVTFTTALKTAWLRVLLKRRYNMSWGPATVFVHQKLRYK